MSTDLTLYQTATESTLKVIGRNFAESGIFGCTNEAQGFVLALQCAADRCTPFDLAKRNHMISGKLSMRADAMLAGFETIGGKFEWLQADREAARAKFSIGGKELTLEYSVEDALDAGFLREAPFADSAPVRRTKYFAKAGSGWHKNMPEMLRARLTSRAMRMIAPSVVVGCYTPEEIADFDAATAAPSAKPAPIPVAVEVMPSGPSAADKLAEAIGENEDAVNAHLRNHGAISGAQTWRDMPEKSLAKLLGKLPEIVAKAKEAVQ